MLHDLHSIHSWHRSAVHSECQCHLDVYLMTVTTRSFVVTIVKCDAVIGKTNWNGCVTTTVFNWIMAVQCVFSHGGGGSGSRNGDGGCNCSGGGVGVNSSSGGGGCHCGTMGYGYKCYPRAKAPAYSHQQFNASLSCF